MKRFLLGVLTILFVRCDHEKTEVDNCVPPSSVSAEQNCFQLGGGLLVTALNSKKSSEGGAFMFWFYPQVNSTDINMSKSNRKWGNVSGDNRIYIPAPYLEGVTIFALKVEMLCGGDVIGEVNTLFELVSLSESCNEWAITVL